MNIRRSAWPVFLISIVLLQCLSCRAVTDYSSKVKHDYSASIVSEGLERTYSIHISSSYEPGMPTPLIIVLHGGGGTGQGMIRLTGFDAVSDRENFIVVYPDGFEKHWNDGRGVQWRAQAENIDDVSFISNLIDHLSHVLNIDAGRIYITGISNGGMMSHRLGCELSERIAAISPVASNIPVNMAPIWSPSRPLPVLIINGTEDPLERWEGGEIRLGRNTYGTVISVAKTVEFWVEKNHCSSLPSVTQLQDKDASDGTTVRIESYGGCQDGAEVVLYAIEGGGHTWAGGLQYLPVSIIGRTSQEFNASEVIWQFFQKHKME